MLTDKRIRELRDHFKREYDREVVVAMEARTISGYDDVMFDTVRALDEVVRLRTLLVAVLPGLDEHWVTYQESAAIVREIEQITGERYKWEALED
jgi:hypothetical protein